MLLRHKASQNDLIVHGQLDHSYTYTIKCFSLHKTLFIVKPFIFLTVLLGTKYSCIFIVMHVYIIEEKRRKENTEPNYFSYQSTPFVPVSTYPHTHIHTSLAISRTPEHPLHDHTYIHI